MEQKYELQQNSSGKLILNPARANGVVVLQDVSSRCFASVDNPNDYKLICIWGAQQGILGRSSFTAAHTYRYTSLRMLSYGLDLMSIHSDGQSGNAAQSSKCATGLGRKTSQHSELVTYLAYIIYAPLRLSGPIITFKK